MDSGDINRVKAKLKEFIREVGLEEKDLEDRCQTKDHIQESGRPPLLLHVLGLRLQPLGDSECDP